MQLETQFCIQGRKKSAGKPITGLQVRFQKLYVYIINIWHSVVDFINNFIVLCSSPQMTLKGLWSHQQTPEFESLMVLMSSTNSEVEL